MVTNTLLKPSHSLQLHNQAQTEYAGAEFRRKPAEFQIECIGLRLNVNELLTSLRLYFLNVSQNAEIQPRRIEKETLINENNCKRQGQGVFRRLL